MTTDLLENLELERNASVTLDRNACDWLELRRAVLAYGGIGPSKDWPRDWVPGDLYRANGPAPDLVAAEAMRAAPWGDSGDDGAMMTYLRRSFAQWESVKAESARQVTHRGPVRKLRPGERSYAELVAELKRKHGAEVDLSGLNPEYVRAYETGERVSIVKRSLDHPPMTYRGTIGATRGLRPRFVLLLSMDL